MKEYMVRVFFPLLTSALIPVEADSPEEAKRKAIDGAHADPFSYEWDWEYKDVLRAVAVPEYKDRLEAEIEADDEADDENFPEEVTDDRKEDDQG